MTERVAALLAEPLDAWDTHLCEKAEGFTEETARMFCALGSWAEGTWAGVVAARLRLQDLNPGQYGSYDPLER